MELVRDFKDINKDNVDLAGGKGASLGEMTQAGIAIPPGFVVLSTAFDRFVEETGIKADIDAVLHSVDHKEIHTVDAASEKIKAMVTGRDFPEDIAEEILKLFRELGTKFVAVRSSATAEDSASAAWAGQLDTFLNTEQESLLENVKKCWASLFTPRAIFYRFEQGLHGQHISVAVVVQKMVESEISGIAFSVHPVTQDRNQLIIEAGFGLGESIVSGQITPDSYVVEKNDWSILDINVSEQSKGLYRSPAGGNEWKTFSSEDGGKQKLSGKQVIELSKLVVNIEKHYGFPVDIEWAIEGGELFITQSRPITTLG
jgi:pyruvate, water dikinase